jgi:hypothetical protein
MPRPNFCRKSEWILNDPDYSSSINARHLNRTPRPKKPPNTFYFLLFFETADLENSK